jgi:MFS family permease
VNNLVFQVNLSVAIIPMSHQYGWNSSTAGLVQSSFFWGYALSQLPGGWLAKLIGGRFVWGNQNSFTYFDTVTQLCLISRPQIRFPTCRYGYYWWLLAMLT